MQHSGAAVMQGSMKQEIYMAKGPQAASSNLGKRSHEMIPDRTADSP